FLLEIGRPPLHPLFPYTTLFRSCPQSIPPSSIACKRRSSWPLSFGCTVKWSGTRSNSWFRSRKRSAATAVTTPSPLENGMRPSRSEEHTSELQSRFDLVCRLLLE